jgi:hypothetical protein
VGRPIALYTNAQGKRSSKKRFVIGHEAAKIKLAELRDEITRELSDRKTFRYVDEFFRREYVHAAKFVGGKKVSGFRQSTGTVENYLDAALEFFGDRPIDSISFADLLEYKSSWPELLQSTKGSIRRRRESKSPAAPIKYGRSSKLLERPISCPPKFPPRN